jgi:hypothetical protein
MASEQMCPTARHSFRGSSTALATLRPVADPNVMPAKQRAPFLLHLERPSRSAVVDVDAHRGAHRLTTRFKSFAPFWTSTGGYLALTWGRGTERPQGPDFSTRSSRRARPTATGCPQVLFRPGEHLSSPKGVRPSWHR